MADTKDISSTLLDESNCRCVILINHFSNYNSTLDHLLYPITSKHILNYEMSLEADDEFIQLLPCHNDRLFIFNHFDLAFFYNP